MGATTKILFLTSFLVLGIPSPSHALSGDLDTAFGNDGITTFNFGGQDQAHAIALDTQSRIVTVGIFEGAEHDHLTVMRQLPDGDLDASFSGNGKTDIHFIGDGDSSGHAVAIQADGKILEAGNHVMDDVTGATDFALARFNDDGSLDTSFNGTGVVTTDMGANDDTILDMAIDASGRIVVVGESGGDFALARYNADGSLDGGFGSGGKVVTSVGSNIDFPRAMALQGDGKILVTGRSVQGGGLDAVLVRYNTDGGLDSGFGSGGKVVTNLGFSADFSEDVAVQSDGKILTAGFIFDGSKDNIALARYNADGSLDSGFGTGGIVITDFGNRSEAYGVAVQPDGRIVVAGTASTGAEGNFGLVRYLPDGSLDAGFASSGLAVTDISPGGSDTAFDLILQPDGKIVAAGSNFGDFAVLRFLVKNTADLKIAGGTSAPTMGVGETAAFTLTVTNIGPDPATEAVVTGSLSGNLGLNQGTLSASTGSCEGGSPFVCRLGTLSSGALVIINYTALASAEGGASSNVAVTTGDEDPDSSDNSASISLDVISAGGTSVPDGGDGSSGEDSGAGAEGSGGSGGGGCSLMLDELPET